MTSCIVSIDGMLSTIPEEEEAATEETPPAPRRKRAAKSRPASPKPHKLAKRASALPAKRSDEFTLQCDCINWLKSAWPGLQMKYTATVGGARLANGPKSYKKLEMMGYLKGVPDVLIFLARGPYHGLFVELKTPTGKFQPSQLQVHQALREEGYLVCVIRDHIDFRDLVDAYARSEMHLVEGMALKFFR